VIVFGGLSYSGGSVKKLVVARAHRYSGRYYILENLRFFFDTKNLSSDNFRRLIEYFLVSGYHPFTTVEERGFKLFVETMRPDLYIPSADTMTRAIAKEFNDVYSEVMGKLANVNSKVSLTLDCWTSDNRKSFMGVTAHWIDNWSLSECLLDFANVNNMHHTGANLANVLIGILDNSALHHKIFAIVADNATNNDTLFDSLSDSNVDVEQVRCFGHILNLVAQGALGQINDSLVALRELIKTIRNSTSKLDMLNSLCQTSGIPKLLPILDVSTRWNSTYLMIERAFEIREVRNEYFGE